MLSDWFQLSRVCWWNLFESLTVGLLYFVAAKFCTVDFIMQIWEFMELQLVSVYMNVYMNVIATIISNRITVFYLLILWK